MNGEHAMIIALLTAALSVFGGVVIFSLNQILQKFLIDRLHEQRKVIGEITYLMIYHANLYSNPLKIGAGTESKPIQPDEYTEFQLEAYRTAFREIRRAASKLMETTTMIPCYMILEAFGIVVKFDSIRQVSKDLIGLANSMFLPVAYEQFSQEFIDGIFHRRESISRNLKIVLPD